jgi:hypothetical protein
MGSERVTFKTADGVAIKGDFFRAGSSSSSPGMLSVAGSMAVISSAVLGADVGAVAYRLSASLLAALLAGAAAGTVLMFATARYQWARWCKASSAPARDAGAA